MAVFILGGGVPKNYTLQGEPLLDQILGVPTDGFDIDVQFCVDPVDNGALSSCPAGEGHTWGKVSAEACRDARCTCHADVTAVFPWLVHALMTGAAARCSRRFSGARRTLRAGRSAAEQAPVVFEVANRRQLLALLLVQAREVEVGVDAAGV
jgi:hypothetical protein